MRLRKWLSLLLSLLMLIALLPFAPLLPKAEAASVWNGTVSGSSGYLASGNTVTISSANGLVYFGQQVQGGDTFSGKTVNLTVDVDLNSKTTFTGLSGSDKPFSGTFNGNGHTISNYYDTRTDTRIGLFRHVKGATIQNLKLQNVKITGANTSSAAIVGYTTGTCTFKQLEVLSGTINVKNRSGGVVGELDGKATFDECVNKAAVTGTNSNGGILGYTSTDGCKFTNCKNTGTITGNDHAGGIVGGYEANDITLENCSNQGAVTAQTSGGIIGLLKGSGTIKNCSNTAKIYGTNGCAGGICGEVDYQRTSVVSCWNSGEVISENDPAGGIMGYSSNDKNSDFTHCINFGNVTSKTTYAAGILAFANAGSSSDRNNFYECANFGTIKGADNSGGIIGEGHWTYLYRCFNIGNIANVNDEKDNCAGGIAGNDVKLVEDCFNTGTITKFDYAAGIVGYELTGGDSNANQTIKNCYNAGNIKDGNVRNHLYGRTGNVKNSFYLSSITAGAQGTSKTAEQLKALASTLDATYYCTDTWNVNNGYPILKWWRDGYFKFPIQFMDGSDTVKELAVYDYAATFTTPTCSKTGYTFNGWYTENTDGTKAANGNATYTVGTTAPSNTVALKTTTSTDKPNVVANTITLYAQYTAKTTAVTLDGNGATVAGTGSVTATYDSAMPAYAAAPQKTGYTFTGYYDAQTGGTQYYAADGTSAKTWDKEDSSFTLFAQWTANDDTAYTVNHYYMDTAGNYPADANPDKTESKTGTTGETVLHADLVSTTIPVGCSYNADKSGSSSVIAADGSTVVKLYYAREKYTVTFKDGATTLDTQQIYYGGAAAAPSVDQYKLYNDSQHYRFTGWDNTFSNITENLTVNAQYVPEEHNWGEKNWTRTPTCTDGGEYTQSCPQCGKVKTVIPSSAGHDFRYADNGNGTHTVTCTKCDYNVVANHTFANGVCVCGARENVTVVFKDYRGDEIQTLTVPYNTVPVYTGGESRKQKPATASTTYTFENWVQEDDSTKVIGAVTADTVYVPFYTETARSYTVVFLNWNGDVLGTEEVAYGASAAALAPTAMKADGRHEYAFTGWSADISNITKNTYAVAQFEATDVANHTVTFTDGAGNTLYTTRVADGEAAVYPMDDPEKEGHTFYGWDKDFSNVTADLTVNALFLPENGDMVGVTFVNYDNTFLKADVIAKGGAAVYGLADPAKPEDEANTYTFAGWDQPLENVQENTVFTAQFTAVPKHTHTYTFVAQQNATCDAAGVKAHYTCDCGKIFDEAYNETQLLDLAIPAIAHRNKTFTEANAATCVAAGNIAYWICPDCGKISANEAFTEIVTDVTTPVDLENGHLWAEIEYVWSDDNTAVTATRACLRSEAHNVSETVRTTYAVVTPATPDHAGEGKYTAVFTNPLFAEQSKTTVIPQPEPDWFAPTYEWSENHATCTATRISKFDPAVSETETVEASSSVTVEPKCGAAGERTYTATFTNSAFEPQTATEAIDALAHIWGEASYVWSDDFATCTATRACTRNCGETQSESAVVSYEDTTPASVYAEGVRTYTAVFSNDAFETQTATASIAKLDPDWDAPRYEWNADHTACTATRVSRIDPALQETETAQSVYGVVTPAACGKAGEAAYTAAFENAAFETQTYTVALEALVHNYGAPVYTWSADNKTVTASMTCGNCGDVISETVTATETVITPATEEAEGEATYTATFTNPAFASQTKTVVLPKVKPSEPPAEDHGASSGSLHFLDWLIRLLKILFESFHRICG